MGPSFSFDQRAEDTRKANLALRRYFCPPHIQAAAIAAGFGPILAGIAVGYLLTIFFFLETSPFLIFAGIGAGWLLAIPLVSRVNRWLLSRLSSVQAIEGEKITFDLGEDAVVVVTADTETTIRWRAIHRAFESDRAILLVYGQTALFIPSSAFSGNEKRSAAIDWILPRLTPEARARSTLHAAS